MSDQLSPAQEKLRDRFDAIDAAYAAQLQTSSNPDQLAITKIRAYAAAYSDYRAQLKRHADGRRSRKERLGASLRK